MRQEWGWSQTGKGGGRVLERAAPGGNSVGQEEAVARKGYSVSNLVNHRPREEGRTIVCEGVQSSETRCLCPNPLLPDGSAAADAAPS